MQLNIRRRINSWRLRNVLTGFSQKHGVSPGRFHEARGNRSACGTNALSHLIVMQVESTVAVFLVRRVHVSGLLLRALLLFLLEDLPQLVDHLGCGKNVGVKFKETKGGHSVHSQIVLGKTFNFRW